jgi:LemA protein
MASHALRNTVVVAVATVAIAAALVIAGVRGYNRLQAADEQVSAGWAHVVNQYQRRADLVPGLARIVQAYARHESGLFQEIAETRSDALSVKPTAALLKDPQALAEYQSAQDHVGAVVSRLLLIAERYPELRSDQAFLDLQAQLEGTENRVTYARGRYIQAVSQFNIMVRSIPTNWIARWLDYGTRPTFTLTAGSAVATAPEMAF